MEAVDGLAMRFNSAAPARQRVPFKPVKYGYELRATVADYGYFFGGVDHMDAPRVPWQHLQPEDMLQGDSSFAALIEGHFGAIMQCAYGMRGERTRRSCSQGARLHRTGAIGCW